MSTEKDKIIEELFGVVQAKREEIKKIEKPEWKTNCSFVSPLNPTSNPRNIRTIVDISDISAKVAELLLLADYNKRADEILEVESDNTWMGFTIDDWISDFKTRVSVLQLTKKKKDLDSLEKRLDKLVSKEKREEMELLAIKKELGV